MNLIGVIPKILLRFRNSSFGVTADIKHAFLQIGVLEKRPRFYAFSVNGSRWKYVYLSTSTSRLRSDLRSISRMLEHYILCLFCCLGCLCVGCFVIIVIFGLLCCHQFDRTLVMFEKFLYCFCIELRGIFTCVDLTHPGTHWLLVKCTCTAVRQYFVYNV